MNLQTTSAIDMQKQKELQQIKDKLLQGLLTVGVPTPVQMQKTAADYRETAEAATVAADSNVVNSNKIVAKTTSAIGDVLNFESEINAALEADKINRMEQATLAEKVSNEAAELAQGSIQRYKETVTSDAANYSFTKTAEAAYKANAEALQTQAVLDSPNESILNKIVSFFKLPIAQKKQMEAQNALDLVQRSRVQSTQIFAQEVQNANTVAAISYQQEIASNTRKVESSAILIDNLAKKRANLNDTISSLAQINQLDSAAVKSLREKMEILQSQQINDANTYASVFNAIESESRIRMADKQLKDIAKSEEAKALLQPMFDAFYALNPNATKVTAKQFFAMNQSEQQALGWADDFKLFARSQAFSAVSPITTAAMKTEARLQLSPTEEVNRQLAVNAVDQYNFNQREQYIQAQMNKGLARSEVELVLSDPNNDVSKALKAKLIDVNNPDHLARADKEGRKALESLSSDSTPLFQAGTIYYSSVQEAAAQQGTAEILQKHVPAELLALIGSPEYAELETRIAKYEDFQRNEVSAVDLALKLATTVTEASQTVFDPARADAQLKAMSLVLAGNYKAQRIMTQKVDYPLINGTKIMSPRVGSGAAGKELVNYEDAGSLYIRLRTRMIQKQAQQSAGMNLINRGVRTNF